MAEPTSDEADAKCDRCGIAIYASQPIILLISEGVGMEILCRSCDRKQQKELEKES